MSEDPSGEGQVKGDKLETLLARERELAEHLEDPANRAREAGERGMLATPFTLVLLGVVAVTGAAWILRNTLLPQFYRGNDGFINLLAGLVIFPFLLASLIALATDWRCHHIQDAPDPLTALRRFFLALRTGRYRKAYAALIPRARRRPEIRPVTFEHVTPAGSLQPFEDRREFKRYWKWLLAPTNQYGRQVRLLQPRQENTDDDRVVRVEAELLFIFTDNSAAGVLGPIGAIVALAARKKERKPFNKTLLRCQDLWWFVEGELQGELDNVALPGETSPA